MGHLTGRWNGGFKVLTKDALSCSKSNISFSYCSATSLPKMMASSHIYWTHEDRDSSVISVCVICLIGEDDTQLLSPRKDRRNENTPSCLASHPSCCWHLNPLQQQRDARHLKCWKAPECLPWTRLEWTGLRWSESSPQISLPSARAAGAAASVCPP